MSRASIKVVSLGDLGFWIFIFIIVICCVWIVGVDGNMQPPRQHSRINLAELRAQMVRKLGPERFKQYFYYLNRLLSLELSKSEFEKLCVQVVGRENIPLHNQFIRSLLKNACCAKVPPPSPYNEHVKNPAEDLEKDISNDDHLQNGYHSSVAHASSSPGLPYGDISLVSPHKRRTNLHDRRVGDRHSALGLNGMNHSASQQFMTTDSGNAILDNGALTPIDTRSLVQHHSLLSHRSEKENELLVQNSAKFSIPRRPPEAPVSVHSKDQSELSAGGDWRDIHARRPLQAPLGVPIGPVTVGGAFRALSVPTSSKCLSASSFGGLLDGVMLRDRMEHISVTQGIQGVSIECANMLNNGLDAYLKRIIGSCIGLVGARFGREPLKNSTNMQQTCSKLINGNTPSDVIHEHRQTFPISLQDFISSMELNPQQLGEDWPVFLEKIYIQSFDE